MSKRVLVLEDDQQSRDALKNLLEGEGYKVCVAGSVEQASTMLGAEALDVAIVDLHLPGLPGDQFATYIKMRQPKARIILVSGEYTVLDPQRFGENTVFIRKPIAMDSLLRAVAGAGIASQPQR